MEEVEREGTCRTMIADVRPEAATVRVATAQFSHRQESQKPPCGTHQDGFGVWAPFSRRVHRRDTTLERDASLGTLSPTLNESSLDV